MTGFLPGFAIILQTAAPFGDMHATQADKDGQAHGPDTRKGFFGARCPVANAVTLC